jgi:stage V sporulation protein S
VEILRVSSKSNPTDVAGAIAGILRDNNDKAVEVRAIGAGAVNQTVKAIAIARGYVAPSGMNLVTVPGFIDVEIEGKERTAIKLVVSDK